MTVQAPHAPSEHPSLVPGKCTDFHPSRKIQKVYTSILACKWGPIWRPPPNKSTIFSKSTKKMHFCWGNGRLSVSRPRCRKLGAKASASDDNNGNNCTEDGRVAPPSTPLNLEHNLPVPNWIRLWWLNPFCHPTQISSTFIWSPATVHCNQSKGTPARITNHFLSHVHPRQKSTMSLYACMCKSMQNAKDTSVSQIEEEVGSNVWMRLFHLKWKSNSFYSRPCEIRICFPQLIPSNCAFFFSRCACVPADLLHCDIKRFWSFVRIMQDLPYKTKFQFKVFSFFFSCILYVLTSNTVARLKMTQQKHTHLFAIHKEYQILCWSLVRLVIPIHVDLSWKASLKILTCKKHVSRLDDSTASCKLWLANCGQFMEHSSLRKTDCQRLLMNFVWALLSETNDFR